MRTLVEGRLWRVSVSTLDTFFFFLKRIEVVSVSISESLPAPTKSTTRKKAISQKKWDHNLESGVPHQLFGCDTPLGMGVDHNLESGVPHHNRKCRH